jgi:hypothetical protein
MDIFNINKKDINTMVGKCLGTLLMEDQAAKSISAAIKLITTSTRTTRENAEYFVRNTMRERSPILRTKKGSKFILGVARLYLEGFQTGRLNSLNSVLRLISSDEYINKFDRNLNGLSFGQLLWKLKDDLNRQVELDKTELSSMNYNSQRKYKIVKIESFKQANEYSGYTSWCITHEERMFNNYTNYCTNQFYFCLAEGFENVPQVTGDNTPLDEYGLSMLAVCVDSEGRLATCTCRWNHDNGGNDNILDTRGISELIGRNFYSVFKPNGNWQNKLTKVISLLKDGVDPDEIFDFVGSEHDGIRAVEIDERGNYLTRENKLLSNEWFDDVNYFSDGYGLVTTQYGDNFIDVNGNYLFPEWHDSLSRMHEGMSIVKSGSKWNFIRKDGSIVSDMWFDDVDSFDGPSARVMDNEMRGYNLIDKEGNLLCDEWYSRIGYLSGPGLRVVCNKSGFCNYVDAMGKVRFKTWFQNAYCFSDSGFASIALKETDEDGDIIRLIIDKDGNIQDNPYGITGKIE